MATINPDGLTIIDAQNLAWSFGTGSNNNGIYAENVSLAVGADESVLSTYVNNADFNWDIYGAYGLLSMSQDNPNFTVVGVDGDFDTGEYPATVAIDPNGLAVSIHETNAAVGRAIWIDVGNATNGTGNLSGAPPYEFTLLSGANPAIIAVGPGAFLIAVRTEPTGLFPPGLYYAQISINNGQISTTFTEISIDDSDPTLSNFTPIPASWPSISYSSSNGILAYLDTSGNVYFGTLDLSSSAPTYTLKAVYKAATNPTKGCYAVVLHPTEETFYVITCFEEQNGSPYNCYLSGVSYSGWEFINLGWSGYVLTNYPDYWAQGVSMAYTQANGLDGLVIACLSSVNCIDLFFVPSSQMVLED